MVRLIYDENRKLRLLMDSHRRVPKNFTEVKYLEANGTQYINTGLLSTGSSKVDVTYGFSSMESGLVNNFAVFGGRSSTTYTKNTFTLFKLATQNPQRFRFDYNGQTYIGSSSNMDWTTSSKFRFTYNGSTMKVVNILTGQSDSALMNPATTYTTQPIYLFSANTLGSAQLNLKGRIYHFWYTDGTTTLDMIPALDTTGKPCMYDIIGKQAYYNLGSGDDFTYGRRIIPVKYIESTGTQYIDSGIIYNTTDTFKIIQDIQGISGSVQKGSGWGAGGGLVYQGTNPKWDTGNSQFQTDGFDFTRRIIGTIEITGSSSSYSMTDGTNTYTATRNNSLTSYAKTTGYPLMQITANNGVMNTGLSSKLYSSKIFINNYLVRDYIPVKDQNNVGYLFDKLNHTLYANSGTGSFVVGEQLKNKIRFIEEEIPSIYERVNYLKASAQQYIDTGIGAKSGVKAEIGFEWGSGDIGSDKYVLAAAHPSYGRVYFGTYQSKWMYGYASYYQAGTPVADTYYKGEVSWEKGNQYMKVNDESLYTGTSTTSVDTGYTLYMFARNQDTPGWYSSAKIYYCKMWEDGVLVRHYVPVIRKSDNKPGMYDRITKQFYVNLRAGVPDFTWG